MSQFGALAPIERHTIGCVLNKFLGTPTAQAIADRSLWLAVAPGSPSQFASSLDRPSPIRGRAWRTARWPMQDAPVWWYDLLVWPAECAKTCACTRCTGTTGARPTLLCSPPPMASQGLVVVVVVVGVRDPPHLPTTAPFRQVLRQWQSLMCVGLGDIAMGTPNSRSACVCMLHVRRACERCRCVCVGVRCSGRYL